MKEKPGKCKTVGLLINLSNADKEGYQVKEQGKEAKLAFIPFHSKKKKPLIISYLYNTRSRKSSDRSSISKQSQLTNYTYLTQRNNNIDKSQISDYALDEEVDISRSFHSSIVSDISGEPIEFSENECSSKHFEKNEI